MKQITNYLFICIAFWAIVIFNSCGEAGLGFSGEKPLFTLMDSSETGFYFWNEIEDKPQLNALNYGYFYNGGGVAVGDINNDGLPDVYMVGNTFGGRLFVNDGDLKFHQITATSNTHTDGFTHGVTMADVNQDGFLDIYLARSMTMSDTQRANVLLINNGDETFTNRAKEYGVDDMGFSTHSNFFDYDNDGDPDLYVLNHSINYDRAMGVITKEQKAKRLNGLNEKEYEATVSKLYRNNGDGTFTDVSAQAGVKDVFFGLSATVSDINDDGWLDLYCTSDFADKDHLYINNKNGTFTDKIHDAFGHISQNSMGADIADIDNDGDLDVLTMDMMAEDNYRNKQLKGNNPYDLFQMSMEYGYHCQVMRNCLQVNNGNGTFSELGQLAGISHTDWSWAPLFADFDNDGKKDLFITNGYKRDITDMDYMNYESDEIIKNAGGKSNVAIMDLLNGIKSTPIPNYAYKNKGNGQFEKSTKNWGLDQKSFSNGAAYADLDLDGDLDLIVNNFGDPSFLYRNNSVQHNPENQFIGFVFQPKQHALAQGTKVTIVTDSGQQYQQLVSNRGFLSAVHPMLHFGLGQKNKVSAVQIEYPNGTIQELKAPALNQLIVLDINKGVAGKFESAAVENQVVLKNIDNAFSPAYVHKESEFIDFKDEPLLEQMYSNRGPFAATGDANGDGLQDLYLSGSATMPGVLYFQNASGRYTKKETLVFMTDKGYEDGQSVFFDADGDKDLDLYVTSGSNEVRDEKLFINRLYINDGKGNFERSNQIPVIQSNTLAVEASDIDGDGDMDLVIGGNVVPKKFPESYASYVLKNNKGTFVADYTLLPNKGALGIVHDIGLIDINSDKQLDIVLAGDWMPITILENNKGAFTNETSQYGFDKTNGMWNTLLIADINDDGKQDIIGGNRGLNGFFKCNPEQPATLFVDDFDDNGEQEAVVNYYFNDGVLYPKYSLNEILEQMPAWRGLFPRYKDYSAAKSADIFTKDKYPDMRTLYCHMFESAAFVSANNKYEQLSLPYQAQYSPVYALAVFESVNGSNLISAGNNYSVDVNQGRLDASFGSMQTISHQQFNALTIAGTLLDGEIRQIIALDNGTQKDALLVLKANSPARIISF